jgi:hypothetical protein
MRLLVFLVLRVVSLVLIANGWIVLGLSVDFVQFIYRVGRIPLAYLTPVNISFLYLNANLLLGYISISSGSFTQDYMLEVSEPVSFFKAWVFISLANTMILFFANSSMPLWLKDFSVGTRYLFPSCMVFLATLAFPLNLAFIGGVGDFSVYPRSISAIVLLFAFKSFKPMKRFALSLTVVVVLFLFNVHDKRQAVFSLIPLLVSLEGFAYKPVSTKGVLVSFLSGLALLFAIISMSIIRGYGELLNPDTFTVVELLAASYDYLYLPEFWSYLGNNLEYNYVCFHALNSIEHSLGSFSNLGLGESYFRVFFLGVPRSLDWKPDSIITLYTEWFAPNYRNSINGSFPIPSLGEAAWNFSWLGLIFYPIILSLADLLVRIPKNTFSWSLMTLFFMQEWLTFTRGSGMDLFFVELVFAFATILFIRFATLLLYEIINSTKRNTSL